MAYGFNNSKSKVEVQEKKPDISVPTGYVGSAVKALSIKYDSQGHITSTTTSDIYPPTSVGKDGQIWESDGTGAGNWVSKDTVPTSGSPNAVTSGGVYTALNGLSRVQKIPLQGTIEDGSLTMTNVQSGDVVSIIVCGDGTPTSIHSVFTFVLQTGSGGTGFMTMTPARLISLADTEEHYWEYLMVQYYNYKWSINLRCDKASDFSYVKTNIVSFEGTILRG